MEGDHNNPKELKSFFTADKQQYTFYFDLATDKAPLKVDVYLEARTLTEEALLIAIEQCNLRLRDSHTELVKEVGLYKARLVGRNFKPKTDMPCLSLFQKICDLKINEIAVQIPNKEKAMRDIAPAKEQTKLVKDLAIATEKLQIGESVEQDRSTAL